MRSSQNFISKIRASPIIPYPKAEVFLKDGDSRACSDAQREPAPLITVNAS